MAFSKKLLLILLAIIIDTLVALPQTDSALNFYPMQKSNFWQYKSTYVERIQGEVVGEATHYYTVSISGDTILPNNKRYFLVDCSDKRTVHPRFQRIDSATAQVFAFDNSNGGKEYLIDSLRAPAFSLFAGCRLTSIPYTGVTKVDSQNYFGSRFLSRHYATLAGLSSSPYIVFTLAQGLGITTMKVGSSDFDQYDGNSTDDTLVYAKLTGKTFGTLVSVANKLETVNRFVLYQNYPNPFNPATTIEYQLLTRSDVILRVFDILGKEVSALVNEKQNAGIHSITFSANNLSTGLYFYQLQAGHLVKTKKLILIK